MSTTPSQGNRNVGCQSWLPQILKVAHNNVFLMFIGMIAAFALTLGCSKASWKAAAQAMASSTAAGAQGVADAQAGSKLMIFGGSGHKTYLGCLNCGEYASDSVFNTYGTFGSSYSQTSIHNRYGEFGSAYSQHSVCNPHATDPPVIVNGVGNFFGRLTLNTYHSQATSDEKTLGWLAAACN